MWAKLDDALIDHRKIFAAGKLLGPNGPAIALGFYTVCLLWTSKHLSDGVVMNDVMAKFAHVKNPASVARALVRAGLLEKTVGGFKIHHFHDHNPRAADVKKHRARVSKARAIAGKNGANMRWHRA